MGGEAGDAAAQELIPREVEPGWGLEQERTPRKEAPLFREEGS